MKLIASMFLALLFLSAPAFADPCTGITRDEALKILKPELVTKVTILDEAEVAKVQKHITDTHPGIGAADENVKHAIHFLMKDGTAGVVTFDKDERLCQGSPIPSDYFWELEEALK